MVEISDKRMAWLAKHERNVYSQFGEDGIIEAILGRIKPRTEWCFEVGASDGVFYSNTMQWRERGWQSLLMDCDTSKFVGLCKHRSERVTCLLVDVTVTKIDAVLGEVGAPRDLDFGVIDIDGQDYHVWDDLVLFVPRVVMVEHAHRVDYPPPPRMADVCGKETVQAGRTAIAELGKRKGYELVCRTDVNSIFILESELSCLLD